jgi:hypothetical protein
MALLTERGDEMRAALRDAMHQFVGTLYATDAEIPSITDHPEEADKIIALSDIVTWVRSAVHRDKFTHDIEVAPEREMPARFAKQLVSLWAALEAMGHADSMGLVRRVAFDSMPPFRSAVLQALGSERAGHQRPPRRVPALQDHEQARAGGPGGARGSETADARRREHRCDLDPH